ncbi:hypothetical protein KSF_042020 [Reticulibacter mediterranei]|uniref:Inner membrane protein YgaP-like transmembrane domain-containing protein n=1 Tax=Reticulibacter mediterranei TaxID=2778369 RepID=A0A8J3IF08_9CHLR|nr:DUF2892 domain-containing protein [Reticulibacter mediterranei]GHO94154.1 hypothetical protein KSF_042020 [Reticulibacter mediterranei]
MLYVKNVPLFERILRALLGLALAASALFIFLQYASFAWPGILLLLSGLFIAATGFLGWCPACAMVGRKLKSNQHIQ